MHRVELKVFSLTTSPSTLSPVPNAPCGVERRPANQKPAHASMVPNAPCGVERIILSMFSLVMLALVPNAPCGVESRPQPPTATRNRPSKVPNAPCGVESTRSLPDTLSLPNLFLMHRVELKVGLQGF